jgi:hypothetical protein
MPAMNPFVGVSATQPREAASFNNSVERTGMSRSGQLQLQRQWRLIPVAHLGRSTKV